MNKQKIIQFVQSVVAIPMLAVATPLVGVSPVPSPAVVLSQNTVTEAPAITTQDAKDIEDRAKKIDALLLAYDSPLAGYGKKFVEEADKNDIDWRLLVAIAGQESTFGRHACKKADNSVFGYGGCRINFPSIDNAIEKVSASLGGNNPNTAHHYEGKNTAQILRKYNSVIPNYPQKVMKLMKMIDDSEEIV